MYYKVIYNGNVIDVLDRLDYVRYQEKHDRMIFCDIQEAQAILSSNGEYAWHLDSLLMIPVSGYDTVELEEIDKYEYKRLKALNIGDSESIAIVDMFVKSIVDNEVDQLVESLKRLCSYDLINEEAAIAFCKKIDISDDITDYIIESNI